MRLKCIFFLLGLLMAQQLSAQTDCEALFCDRICKNVDLIKKSLFAEKSLSLVKKKFDLREIKIDTAKVNIVDSRLFRIPALYFKHKSGRKMKQSENFLCMLDVNTCRIHESWLFYDVSSYYVVNSFEIRNGIDLFEYSDPGYARTLCEKIDSIYPCQGFHWKR